MSEPYTSAVELAQLALLGEAAANLSGLAVFVWDDDRHYVAVNDEACRLTGRKRAELLEMRVGDMTPDRAAPQFDAARQKPITTGSSWFSHDDGPVEIEWVTCHTRIAGLPYLVSFCWRKGER